MLAKELRARRLEWTKGGHLGHLSLKEVRQKGMFKKVRSQKNT